MPVFLKSPLHLWSVEICEASWWCLGQESTTFLWSHNGKTKHRWRTWCGGFEVEKKTCWTKNTYSWDIRVSSVKWLWHLSHFQGGWTSINRLYFVKNIHKFQLFWCELQVFFFQRLGAPSQAMTRRRSQEWMGSAASQQEALNDLVHWVPSWGWCSKLLAKLVHMTLISLGFMNVYDIYIYISN